MIFDLADSIVFRDSEYSHQIIGTKKTLQKIKLEDIDNFHNQYFTSNNCIISYIGNQNHEIILENIHKLNNTHFNNNNDDKQDHKQLKLKALDKIEIHKPTQLLHLIIAAYVPNYNKNDRFALYLLNNVLGDGMSSRLNKLLREKHSLAYNIYSSFQLYAKQGAFYIYAEVNQKNSQLAEQLIYNEIQKIINNGISKKELQKAKEQIKTSIVLEFENMTERMESLIKDELRIGNLETQESFMDSIENITINQVQTVARKYFQKDNLMKAVILPK